jgi:hypothetical protein
MARLDIHGSGSARGGRVARLARRLGARHGQSTVEFALIVPIMLLIVFGIWDFAQAYNYKNDMTSMANQAVRYAEVNSCAPCTGQPIEDYIKSTADSPALKSGSGGSLGIASPGVTITFCAPGPPGQAGKQGQPLEAVATAKYQFLPFLKLANVTITSTAIGRIETPYDSGNPGNNAYAQSGLASCP